MARNRVNINKLSDALKHAQVQQITGRVVHAVGPILEAELPGAILGSICEVGHGKLSEVVGFKEQRALLMPLESTEGVAYGTKVVTRDTAIWAPVGPELLGRVVNGLGKPIDSGPEITTAERRPVIAKAPNPLSRPIISEPLFTGVRAIDGLITLGKGQRISIMSGSGVGKSTLLGMIAKNVNCDVNVICLVGERGREVQEFILHNLGEEGLKNSVLVVITSDESPALQVKGTFLATTIAEYFRDQGLSVLLLMDSLTRLALAQRQIGLAAGEPPTTRGFTPSVFGLLAPLLERAGPGEPPGSITAVYTVLVEGDDVNDPIGDAVRGIVDGHIVLSRKLASHGHYPAIDVLSSLSRIMAQVTDPEHQATASKVRDLLATWSENEELIRLGAYRKGSSKPVDEAISRHPMIKDFLIQDVKDPTEPNEMLQRLTSAVS
jgi:flagellum-specific ATP synthase